MHIPRIIVSSSQFHNYQEVKTLPVSVDEIQNQNLSSHDFFLELDDKQTRHLTRSLRKNEGSNLELLVREDCLLFAGKIVATNKKTCKVQIHSALTTIAPSPIVHLLIAQANNKVIEQLVQQATECGISSCTVYPGDHTGNKTRINLERLELIRDSAVEQARLTHIPQIRLLDSLQQVIESIQGLGTHRLLCVSPNEDYSKTLQIPLITELFPKTQKKHDESNYSLEKQAESVEIYIAVGPEGGFSLSEIKLHLSNGFRTTSLGPYVARVETAVTIAAGVSRLAAV